MSATCILTPSYSIWQRLPTTTRYEQCLLTETNRFELTSRVKIVEATRHTIENGRDAEGLFQVISECIIQATQRDAGYRRLMADFTATAIADKEVRKGASDVGQAFSQFEGDFLAAIGDIQTYSIGQYSALCSPSHQ